MNSIFVFVALFLAFCQLTSQQCPESPVISNFDSQRYLGKWYEIERLPTVFQDNLKCSTAVYSLRNSTAIDVLNSGYNPLFARYDSINGYAFVPNSNEPNKLSVKLPVTINGLVIENNGKYDVWSTDYDHYSLVYSCQQITPNLKVELSWILSRTPTLDQQTIANLKSLLSAKNIDTSKFVATPQDCNN